MVYILIYSSGCRYEGGSDIILGVYASKTDAYLAAKNEVDDKAWKELPIDGELMWDIPHDDVYNIWRIDEWRVQ